MRLNLSVKIQHIKHQSFATYFNFMPIYKLSLLKCNEKIIRISGKTKQYKLKYKNKITRNCFLLYIKRKTLQDRFIHIAKSSLSDYRSSSLNPMIWKNLQSRCIETIGRDPRCISQCDRCLSAVHRSQLIAWLAAHDFLSDPTYYCRIVRKNLNRNVLGLELDGNQLSNECLQWLGSQFEQLTALKVCCSFKSLDIGISSMLKDMKSLQWLDIRELKVERSDIFANFKSETLERIFLQLYVRDYDWNEVETLVEHHPSITHLTFNARGRTLRREDTLLLKISNCLEHSLVELEMDNFAADKGALSVLLLTCRKLKRIKLCGSLQLDSDTMTRCRQICRWELLDLTFQVTPPRETYDALQHLPTTLKELAFKFGPSNRSLILVSFAAVPHLTKIRYHTEFFNDQLINNLLSAVDCSILESLDIGLCENLTDDGLEYIATACKQLRTLYLHSDVNKCNRQVTGMPLCRLIENSSMASNFKVLYFNYFKQLSSDFLQIIAAECHNLEELHVASVRGVNDTVLQLFAKNCTKMKCVDISGCWVVTDKGVISLIDNLNLINLNVAMCLKLTNQCIVALARNCPNLERFIYHGVPGMKRSPTIAQLQMYCIKRLKNYFFQWYS